MYIFHAGMTTSAMQHARPSFTRCGDGVKEAKTDTAPSKDCSDGCDTMRRAARSYESTAVMVRWRVLKMRRARTSCES